MLRLNFVLKETKAKDETLIVCAFRIDNVRFNLSTKQKVIPKYWNKDKQRIKDTVNVSNVSNINLQLNLFEDTARSIYEKFISTYERKPIKEEFKNLFDLEYFQQNPQFKKVEQKTIADYFDDYVDTIKSNTANSTVQKYKQAKNNFEDFQKLKRRVYNTEMIDLKFRNDYVDFLINVQNYAPTTVYRKMKFLRTVLYFIEEQGIKVNPFLHNSRFLTKDVEVDNIALSEKELVEMESLDLSKDKRLEQVRDLFLIACYTGQRFSDLNKVDKNNIIDDEYISIRQQKTNEAITLPLLNSVRRILIKYNYRLPKISNVKFNEYIKEVAEKCNTLEIPCSSENETPRYKMVSSHTARRTFVTLNYSKGIDLDTLKIGTGHKQTKTLQTYIKMNDKQKADLLRSKLEPTKEPQPKAKVININKVINE
ncbi:site-specific integrase [Empedobacter sp. GD03865]|uniref:site-specific integrase n=1 Tax=Empedobacter sp. GD03865 TaxID=2975392 RepID=UPI002449986A|nr:site-specific integrase [Empedobacter sp. GD03865]MDH0660448.1 site-specific integrase [Empedobacter sp. GD03865]